MSTYKGALRWIVLMIICFCVFSFRYCHNNPFALQNQLQDEYNLSSVEYNLLYSIYGYVGLIAPLLSGFLIDCWGINTSSVFFYVCIAIGQSLWIFGCMSSSFPLMVFGRGVFGFGATQFQTSRKYYTVEYFMDKEYTFSCSMTLFVSRIASGTQSYITTIIYDDTKSIIAALSVGWSLVLLSLITLIVFVVSRKINFDFKNTTKQETNPLISKTNNNKRSKFNLDGLWNGSLDKRVWIITFELTCFYSSYVSFTNVSSSFLQSRYDYSYDTANELTPIIFFIGAFTLPIIGVICDKYGKRCQLLTLSSILLILAHCILGFSDHNQETFVIPIIGLTLFGFGMGIGAAILWPLYGLICDKQYLPTALGVMSCLDMGFQATSFLIVGFLTKENDQNDQYIYITFWVLMLAVLMFITNLSLWYYDSTQFGNRLSHKQATIANDDVKKMNDTKFTNNDIELRRS